MAVIASLEVQMFAGIARIQKDMNDIKGIVGSSMKSIESAVSSAKNVLASLGVGLSVGALVAYTKHIIDAADAMNDLSQRVGISVKDLAKYELATKQSGTTMEALAKGIKGISTNMLEHGDALKKAGLSATTADGAMRQLADLFSKMPDGLEKTALAVKLFGKSGMDLIPMLNMGSKGLDEAAEKSAKYAATMALLAPRADEFNDNMAELGMLSKLAAMNLAVDLVDALTKVSQAMIVAQQKGEGFWATMNAGIWAFENEMSKKFPNTFESYATAMPRQIETLKGQLETIRASQDNLLTKIFGQKGTIRADIDAKISELAHAEAAYKKYLGTTTGNAGRGNVNPAGIKADPADVRQQVEEILKIFNDARTSAKTTVDAYAKIQDAADKYIATLLKEADQLGLTDKEKALYNASSIAMTLHTEAERKALMDKAVASIDEIDAYKAATKAAEERTKAEEALNQAIAASIKGMTDSYESVLKEAQAEEDRVAKLGLTTEQLGLLRLAEIDLMITQAERAAQTPELDAAELAAIELKITAYKRLRAATGAGTEKQAGLDAAKKVAEEWKHGWEETDRIAREAFTSWADSGKSAAQVIGDALKKALLSAIYEATIRPLAFQLYTSVLGGAGGGGGLLGAAGSASSAYSSATAGAGLFTSMASSYTAATTGASVLATELGVTSSSLVGVNAALSTTLAGIPVYGWIALAALAVFSSQGKDVPKLEGGYAPGGMSIAGLDALGQQQGSQRGDVAGAQTIAATIAASYQVISKQLGLVSNKLDVGVFYAQDPTGDSRTQLQIVGGAYNRSNAMGGIENAGKTSEELQAAIATSAAHLVLTNLQASDLPAYLKQIFNTLTDASTVDQINSAIAFASGLKQIRDALTETRTPLQIMADDMKALGTSAETFKTDFVAAIDAGITPEGIAAWQHLGAEIEADTTAADAAAKATKDAADAAKAAADAFAIFTAIANTNKDVQGQLNDLLALANGQTQQQVDRTNTLNGIMEQFGKTTDQTTFDLQNQIYVQQDLAAAAAAYNTIQATNAGLQGELNDKTALNNGATQQYIDRTNILNGIMREFGKTTNQTTFDLQNQIFAQEDLAAAAKKVIDVMAAWTQMESDNAATYTALMDKWTSAIKSAYASVQSTLASVGSAVQALQDKQIAAQQKVNDLTKSAAENLYKFAGTIGDFLDTINPTKTGSLASLKAQLSATAVLAAGGDVGAQGKLIGQAQAVLKAAEAGSTSALEYARSEAFVRNTLEPIQKKATTQSADLLATLTTTVSTAGLDIAHSLGLTGIAADKMAGLLSNAGTASTTLATLLAKPGGAAILLSGDFGTSSGKLAVAWQTLNNANAEYAAGLKATVDLMLPPIATELDKLQIALSAYDDANLGLAKVIYDAGVATGLGVDDWAKKLGMASDEAGKFAAAVANAQKGITHTVDVPDPAPLEDQATRDARNLFAKNKTAMDYHPDGPEQSGVDYWASEIRRIGLSAVYGDFTRTVDAYAGLHPLATGTNYLQQDGAFYGHQGETVTPRPFVDIERSARAETNALMARLVASNERLEAKVAALQKPADATASATERHKDIAEQVAVGGLSVQTRAAGTPA